MLHYRLRPLPLLLVHGCIFDNYGGLSRNLHLGKPLERISGRNTGLNVASAAGRGTGTGRSDESVERKTKGQKKREAHRAVDWGVQLASLSGTQLRHAIKWGGFDEEVYEAIMLVKNIGRDAKNGRRRQFNFIGGLLRDTDPDLMEAVIKASKDGDVEGIFTGSTSGSAQTEERDLADQETEAGVTGKI